MFKIDNEKHATVQNNSEKQESVQEHVLDFFDKEILPLYERKRTEFSWDGYSSEVGAYLKDQFCKTAEAYHFLDELGIGEGQAWSYIVDFLPLKIEAVEASIVNHQSEPELQDDAEIPPLQETAIKNESQLITAGEKVQCLRTAYLEKEYEVQKLTTKLKSLFDIDSSDLGNTQEDLQQAKQDYQNSVQEYIREIIDAEEIQDTEEQEILFNYCAVQESLKTQNEKLAIKTAHNPKMLSFLGEVGKGYLRGYTKTTNFLSKKAMELVGKKTDSKSLQFLGGVGGGVAFSVGISNIFKTAGAPYWATKAVLLASSTAAMTLENKEILDATQNEEESKVLHERKKIVLEALQQKTDAELATAMKTLFTDEASKAMGYQEGSDARNKKRWFQAFRKALGRNALFYSAGVGVSELLQNFSEFLGNVKQEYTNLPEETEKNLTSPTTPDSEKSVLPSESQTESEPKASLSEKATNGETYSPDTVISVIPPEEVPLPDTISPEVSESAPHSTINTHPLTVEESLEKAPEGILKAPQGLTGIFIDEQGKGELVIEKGSFMQDAVATLLAQNSDKLTEGNMGWDASKYTSVDEWANKRAVGIVGEFTHGKSTFNTIPVGTKLILDVRNVGDIKILDLVKPGSLKDLWTLFKRM